MEAYNQRPEDVLSSLDANLEKGLDTHEIGMRREKYGYNELKAKKKASPLLLFINQFRSFIIYILFFALAISAISGEYIDAIVILTILVFNAVFGFIQEYKAEKALQSLKKIAGLKAQVLRNGKIEKIDTRELIVGDIILLEEGSKVPADARIIESASIMISEASLTGESVPVSKIVDAIQGDLVIQDQKNMVFSGTVVTRGRCKAVVVSIGMNTQIGKIAKMITEVVEEQTPLQKKLESLGKKIGLATIIICFIVFISGVIKEDLTHLLFEGNYLEFVFAAKVWFLTAVSLAVAAVPEGLPAIVTIALAIGVRKMVKRNALIRKLPSVETLGEATVICSDKTGTITKNEMTVRKAYTNYKRLEIAGEGYELEGDITSSDGVFNKDSELLFKIGALCNNATINKIEGKMNVTGDPTEIALLVSAEKAGIKIKDAVTEWKRTDEEPFDSIRKMMSTIHKDPDSAKKFVFIKGAPEVVLEHCDRIIINGDIKKLSEKDRDDILNKNDEFAKQALRVLGFAYKQYGERGDMEKDLIFVGLQGMIDPPHREVKDAVKRCKEAGVRIIMITGDNQHTAEAVGREIGLEARSMDGKDFEKLSDKEQYEAVKNISIFSRVEPSHKMTIVNLLQKQDEIVAMTGDGVNDAPAIKRANLGISMGITGTDVAKEASDMVLLDDNFTSIVNSIEEGRGIYENITKFVNYLLSSNLGEVMVIFFAIVLGLPLPMTAIMLLWLNLVTDGLPALALSVDPNSKDLMKKPPNRDRNKIMTRKMFFHIFFVAVLITVGVLGLFYWGIQTYAGTEYFLERIQTLAFSAIVILEFVRLQAIRSEYKLSLFSNKYLVLAVTTSILLQLMIIYTPLSPFFGTFRLSLLDWGMIAIVSVAVFIINIIEQKLTRNVKWLEG